MINEAVQTENVLCVGELCATTVNRLLARFGLAAEWTAKDAPIPASFWGDREAGIAGEIVYVRADTPVHSMLHEACHIVCMPAARRAHLHRDAGGDDLEESAVCYLQIVLANYLPGVGASRLMADMDAWGYSFRSGSTASWFSEDAEDARDWLVRKALMSADGVPSFKLRDD